MPGVLFLLTIPTAKYEGELRNESKVHQQHFPNDEIVKYDEVNETPPLKIRRNKLPLEQVSNNTYINDACWTKSRDGNYLQVSFNVVGKNKFTNTLKILTDVGLSGKKTHTSLSVLPCTLHHGSERYDFLLDSLDDDYSEKSSWESFIQSVRARITVADVIRQIKTDATITFDFLFLLLVAAFIAAVGLIENNSVFLVASMLISPLMGPITAGTFGTAIRDCSLLKLGIKSELIGVICCLIIGFVYGTISFSISEFHGLKDWQTVEIMSRCDLRSLWVGALVAIPSGAAVVISVLSENMSSLVGVAISASILPPAVNAGIVWSLSLTHYLYFDKFASTFNLNMTKNYSDNPAIELAIDGLISLTLTLINIIVIYLTGIFIYIMKEVAPSNSPDVQFWKKDLKLVRDLNKTIADEAKTNVENESAVKNSIQMDPDTFEYILKSGVSRKDLVNRLVKSNGSHLTWSPMQYTKKASIKELTGLYDQFNKNQPVKCERRSIPNQTTQIYDDLNDENLIQNVQTNQKRFTVVRVNELQSYN